MQVKIIAEAGCSHKGDLEKAKWMIHVAEECGADAIKFQVFNPELINDPSLRPFLREAKLSIEQLLELKSYAFDEGIEFICSPFDPESIDILEKIELKTLKIPSGQMYNESYLQQIGSLGKKLIVSTGMATMIDVYAALGALLDAGAQKEDITLLHCVTAYPAPIDELNLRVIPSMQELGCDVGFSDHTQGNIAAMVAVAMGATILEKHFALGRDRQNPDDQVSLVPELFSSYVDSIRYAEEMLGSEIKKQQPCEDAWTFRKDFRQWER